MPPPKSPPANDNTPSSPEANGNERTPRVVGIDELISEAEHLRNLLQDVTSRLTRLTASLKHHRR